MLNHYENEKHLMLQTFLENDFWKTEIKYKVLIDENWAAHAQNYISNPYFLPAKAEPYQIVYENTGTGRILKTGYENSCIATDDDKLTLLKYEKLEAERVKVFRSTEIEKITLGDLENRKLSFDFPKIETLYQPLKRSKVLISNMPKIHDQAGFGSCMVYALGAVIQQNIFTYEQYYNNNIINKNKVPDKLDISYFGLKVFTRGNKRSYDDEADRFDFERGYEAGDYRLGEDYNDLNIGYDKKGFFYTNECNNLDYIPLNMRYKNKFNEDLLKKNPKIM